MIENIIKSYEIKVDERNRFAFPSKTRSKVSREIYLRDLHSDPDFILLLSEEHVKDNPVLQRKAPLPSSASFKLDDLLAHHKNIGDLYKVKVDVKWRVNLGERYKQKIINADKTLSLIDFGDYFLLYFGNLNSYYKKIGINQK